MNDVSEAIARWLEQKRRTDRALAAAISVLALGSGTAVFLLTSLLIYIVLSIVCGAFVHSVFWPGLAALGLTAGFYARTLKSRRHELDLELDPMGYWILKDICSVGPRLILEGLRQVRCCGQLGELNVAACARALAYLAGKNAAFRLRLRWMLEREQSAAKAQEPARPRSEPPPHAVPVNEPERLSAYEILGLSPSASALEIKIAYRKRMKECHPDLFAGMDQQAKVLAERWTKALNAAYSTLNPRHQGARPSSTRQKI